MIMLILENLGACDVTLFLLLPFHKSGIKCGEKGCTCTSFSPSGPSPGAEIRHKPECELLPLSQLCGFGKAVYRL